MKKARSGRDVGQATLPAMGRRSGRPYVFMRGGYLPVMAVYEFIKFDEFIKSPEMPFSVIPAQAGIQSFQALLDSRSPTTNFEDRLRGSGRLGDFLQTHQCCVP